MIVIRLQRIGKKHQPSYRLVVAERRSKLIAPPTEDLGSYSTLNKQAHLKADRIQYWLGVGARPTVTAHNLLVREGIVSTSKQKVRMEKPKAKEAPAPAAAAEVPAEEAAPAEAPAEEAAS